jgi:hypothetical protein
MDSPAISEFQRGLLTDEPALVPWFAAVSTLSCLSLSIRKRTFADITVRL